MTAAERVALRIAVRPGAEPLAILGTAGGAYTSFDGGDNWTKNATIGGSVNDVVFDRTDTKYVYVATNGAMLRSTDGGNLFIPIYYSTFPADANVKSMALDPYDEKTMYISTGRGIFVTHNLRDANVEWKPLEGMQSVLNVPNIAACTLHPGHLYALTRLSLHTINYGGAPPESAIIETWDGGKTWRTLFTGRGNGLAETFAMDRQDPDQLWIGWSLSMFRLERVKPDAEAAEAETRRKTPMTDEDRGPSMSEVILATLHHHGLHMEEYAEKLDNQESRNLLPRVVTVSANYRQWSVGGLLDDQQFAAQRYLQIGDAKEWRVMAWASWNLPELVYNADAVPMLRQRITTLNDELRGRLIGTIRHSYGELERVRALLAETELDLKTRLLYRVRIQQLEAVVDLTSGGYLSRWQKKHRRPK
jgi:hypothetical protein